MAVWRRRALEKAPRTYRRRKLSIEQLESRAMMAAQPIINEFLASNDGVIQDVDGDFSDYIELYNQGDQTVNLAGWYLTDDDELLTKWQFPSVNLAAGQYLVVFASEKDRDIAGSELHTNFRLDTDGEFLALVQPNGTTVASQFSPEFPPQFENVSYGIAATSASTNLLDVGSATRVLIPSSGSLGTTWTQASFVPDASWGSGTLGVGYSTIDEPTPSTTVLQIDFNDRGVPGNTEPGFSSFVIGGTEGTVQSGSVTRSFGGGIDVTLLNASSFPYDDRRRTTPVDSGSFTDGQLLQDFVFSRDETEIGGLDVLIDGLVGGATYTLTVWSYDSGSPGLRISDWAANGVEFADYSFEGSATPLSNDTYRFGLVVQANGQGEILLQGRRDEITNDFAVFLNALRIETGDTLNEPSTSVLRVDFNDRTEGEAGTANSEPGYSTMTLDDNSAVFDGTTVTISAIGGAVLDDRDRTGPVDSGAFTLDQIYDDVIYTTGSAGSGMEVLIEGLAPNTEYDVLLRSYDFGAAGARQSNWTEVTSGVVIAMPYTVNGSVVPTSNDQNVMRASLVSSPQGTLQLRGVQTTADRSVMLNAIELTRTTFGAVVGTDVESDMRQNNSSAYIRVPFSVNNLAAIDQLLLEMRYDAGFVAYLNGQEVARRNAPTAAGVPPAFNAAATTERSNTEALASETINLTAFKNLLSSGGSNVLAIHGLNSAASDSDFLIAPRLVTVDVSGQALRYFETPTPGEANSTGVIDFVAPVQTNVQHGFFDSPFSVTLTTPTAGSQVYYTFDGSIPGPGNPTAALYTTPISIDTTTVFRAAAVKPGFASSPVNTQTYIFLEDVLAQDPLANPNGLVYPTIWQANATADYKMDSRVVSQWDDNNPANDDFGIREAMKSLPTMSIVMDHDDLWNASSGIYPNATSQGDSWRRPGSIEYFDPNTGEQFQANVGVQMHGAASRDNVRLKKHSFRLIFNPEFDGPGRLEFPLFDNSDFADINTVVMRASFTDSFATRTQSGRYSPLDSTYTRDVWMRDMQLAMGSLSADSTYVHLYINGLYWGLYSPAERPDDAFLASHIGGAEEDWDIVKDFNELFRGSRTAYDAMFSLARQLPGSGNPNAVFYQLQGRNTNGTPNAALPVYLDVDNFIDYMILHLYAGAEDWPSHNWYAARNRVEPGNGFQFFTWDQEIVMDGRYRDRTENANNVSTPGELFQLLRSSSEFRLRFADRVQKHLFNDGALTNEAAQAVWQARADQIEAAIIGESARWGDARENEVVSIPPTTTIPLMTVDIWRDSIANVRDMQIPQSHSLAISRFQADGLFPSIAAPVFNKFGGAILPGFSLNITTSVPGGTIWFTTNGQDARQVGGAVSPSAMQFTSNQQINVTTTVKARTLVSGQWSPLTEATFVVPPSGDGIVISELNYHPYDVTTAEAVAVPGVTEDDFEFIEILNTHPTSAINLNNLKLANGLTFTFGNVNLGAGQYGVVVENVAAFQARYGSGHNVLGEWNGGLSNSGETIELRDPLGGMMMAISYADVNPWSEAADGDGATLQLVDAFDTQGAQLGSWYSWRASTQFGGSPGAAGSDSVGVVINEVRSHSTSPSTDAIELHNTTDATINIGGWYLSDSGSSPLKFQIPGGTMLAAGAYIVFDEHDFNPPLPPAGQTAFALNAYEGDDVFLVIPNGSGGVSAIVDSVHFGPAFNGESFGRVDNGDGRLAPMNRTTLGGPNGNPRVGPLVISEINYKPGPPSGAALSIDPSLTEAQLEFIEIFNPTSSTVSLNNHGLAGDVVFNFAPGASLAAGQSIVIVPFDPAAPANAARAAAFRAHYGIASAVAPAGPFAEALSDLGARVELQLPDDPPPEQPALIPKVLGDEVLYDALAPWPTSTTGHSIHRVVPTAFGNDGAGWQSAMPTPGSVNFTAALPGDFSGDGERTLADFDLLVDAVELQSPITYYNLNGDSSINLQDIRFLVQNVVAPIAGDYNWDTVVDTLDYGVWRARFGSQLYLNADGNGDGRVDVADYVVWRKNEGTAAPAAAAAILPTSGAMSALTPSASLVIAPMFDRSTDLMPTWTHRSRPFEPATRMDLAGGDELLLTVTQTPTPSSSGGERREAIDDVLDSNGAAFDALNDPELPATQSEWDFAAVDEALERLAGG